MVSCQWRLTTGPRAGQACGKGTKVFCGSHEPKALEAVRRIDYYGNRLTAKYLEEYFDLEPILKRNDGVDFSASWIWQGDELNPRATNSKINAIQFITNPEVVSTWLEEQLSNATIRNGQIFPVPVTESQRRAISKLQYIFNQRKTMSQNFNPESSFVPLPFFQNDGIRRGGYYRNFTQQKQQVYNRGFTIFLQECVAYTPDYAAVWGWFYPRFTREIARILNAYKGQNAYDMDAISEDLRQLLRAYSLDLASRPDSNGYSNRYRR